MAKFKPVLKEVDGIVIRTPWIKVPEKRAIEKEEKLKKERKKRKKEKTYQSEDSTERK